MAKVSTTLLIIEDELAIRKFVKASLDAHSYKLLEATDGAQGLRMTATENPSLVLLDLGLPDQDGLDVLKSIREWSPVPVIVISARGREPDKVAALDAGADDYLTKPFGINELLARIRVALRHAVALGKEPEPIFESKHLKVDIVHRRVFTDGKEVHLTPNEYKLMLCLVRNAGKVVTHKQLLTEVWGPAHAMEENHYLRVCMGNLRHKLEKIPAQPELFVNEAGVGYRLQVD